MPPQRPDRHHVVVLGASPKPGRYSHQALRLLQDQGYRVTPVHPKAARILGFPVVPRLDAVSRPVDTLTLYVGPQRLAAQVKELIALRPGRVIFNPGTESPELEVQLDAAGIPWLRACTLVMLRTGVFLEDLPD